MFMSEMLTFFPPQMSLRNCQILTMMLRKFNFPTITLHSMMKQVRLALFAAVTVTHCHISR